MSQVGEVIRSEAAWEGRVDAELMGLRASREAGTLLAWDSAHALYHFDAQGRLLGRWVCPHEIVTAAVSADGRVAMALTSQSRLVQFDPLLIVKREDRAPPQPIALALDGEGAYLAIASADRENYLLDATGRRLAQFTTQRPQPFLALLNDHPLVLGATDDGTLSAFDLSGKTQWQRHTAYRAAGLFATPSGEVVLMPANKHGLVRMRRDGKRHAVWPFAEGIIAASANESGNLVFAGLTSRRVELLDEQQAVRWHMATPAEIVEVWLEPLARRGVIGLRSGAILGITLRREMH